MSGRADAVALEGEWLPVGDSDVAAWKALMGPDAPPLRGHRRHPPGDRGFLTGEHDEMVESVSRMRGATVEDGGLTSVDGYTLEVPGELVDADRALSTRGWACARESDERERGRGRVLRRAAVAQAALRPSSRIERALAPGTLAELLGPTG